MPKREATASLNLMTRGAPETPEPSRRCVSVVSQGSRLEVRLIQGTSMSERKAVRMAVVKGCGTVPMV